MLNRISVSALLFLAPLAWSMRNENSALAKAFALGVLTAFTVLAGGGWRGFLSRRFAPLHALLLACTASAAFTRSPSFALMSLLPILTLWLLARASTDAPRRILRPAILLSAVIPVILGILQALGLDPTTWQAVVDGNFHGRVCSTLGNPNFLGAFLVAVLPFAMWTAFRRPGARRVAGFAFAGAILACLLFTGSKGALAGLLAASIAFAVGARRAGFRQGVSIRAFLIGLVAFHAVGALTLSLMPAVARERLLNVATYGESVKFRVLTWSQVLPMFGEAPVAGHGLGRFVVVYPKFRLPEIIRMFGQHSYMTDHPENLTLEILAELGLVGLVLWLWLLAAVARALWIRLKSPDPDERWFGAAALSSLAGLLATNSVGVDVHYGSTAVLAAVLVGAALSRGNPPEPARWKLRPLPGAFALLLALAWARVFGSDAGLARAIAFSSAGDWNPAIASYEASRRLNPANIITRYFGGAAYLDRGAPEDLGRAREWLESVVREAPDYVLVNYKMHLLCSKIGDARGAAEYLARQTQLDPVAAVFFLDRGRIAMQEGRPEDARIEFAKAVEAEPDNPVGYQYLGNLLVTQGRYREALSVYGKGLARRPDSVELLYNSAVAAYQMGDRELARRHAQATLKLDPANAGARTIMVKTQ